MESLNISQFKKNVDVILEKMFRSNEPVLITKEGRTITKLSPAEVGSTRDEREWFGCLSSTGEIVGDIVSPLSDEDWDVLSR